MIANLFFNFVLYYYLSIIYITYMLAGIVILLLLVIILPIVSVFVTRKLTIDNAFMYEMPCDSGCNASNSPGIVLGGKVSDFDVSGQSGKYQVFTMNSDLTMVPGESSSFEKTFINNPGNYRITCEAKE